MSKLNLETVVSDLFAENAYIFWRQGDTSAVVVDPGFSPDWILNVLEEHSLAPEVILLTHGHSDHIAGVGSLKERWPDCPVVIGQGDAYKLTDPQGNLSAQYGLPFVMPPADRTVVEGDTITALGVEFAVRDTPGHSAGHVVYVFREAGQQYVLGGDVLFQGSIGRTDFADGSPEALRQSIHQKLFTLPDDTVVYPGHGPTTTIGEERRGNPFVGEDAG